MDETLQTALDATSILDRLGIRWFLGGSLASSLLGVPRATLDADIVADSEIQIPVCSIEDIILAKLEWFRLGGEHSERQWSDVVGVLRVNTDTLDMSYLREGATDLQVADLLERALESTPPAI